MFACFAYSGFEAAFDQNLGFLDGDVSDGKVVAISVSKDIEPAELLLFEKTSLTGAKDSGQIALAQDFVMNDQVFAAGTRVQLLETIKLNETSHGFASILLLQSAKSSARILVSSVTLSADRTYLGVIRSKEINQEFGLSRGSLIQLPHADVPVEQVEIGDEVDCADGILREVSDITRTRFSAIELLFYPWLRPISILAGTLPGGRPGLKLSVSQLTDILVSTEYSATDANTTDTIAHAAELLGRPGISRIIPGCGVEYFSISLDEPAMVSANGLWVSCETSTEVFVPLEARHLAVAEYVA